MNGEEYANVLRTFLPQMKEQIENPIFVQDNASIHMVEEVQNVIIDHNVETLNWPARSPDLNPIENLWGWMVKKLNQMINDQGEAQNERELFRRVKEVFDEVDNELIAKYYESMIRRLQAVIDERGSRTKY